MRIIGDRDYYDGTAFRSDGSILSLLVYRRDADRSASHSWINGTLGTRPRPLRIRLATFDDGPRPRRPLDSILKSRDSIAHVRWNGCGIRMDEGAALFCGTVRRAVLVRSAPTWADGGTGMDREWCWSADDLETAAASHGLRIEAGWDRTWFDPVQVHDCAREAGLNVATLDPQDVRRPRTPWRIEAATLGAMDFRRVLDEKEALRRLADWIGGRPPVSSGSRVRAIPSFR